MNDRTRHSYQVECVHSRRPSFMVVFFCLSVLGIVGCANKELQILPYSITLGLVPPSITLSSPGGIINYGPIVSPTPSPSPSPH